MVMRVVEIVTHIDTAISVVLDTNTSSEAVCNKEYERDEELMRSRGLSGQFLEYLNQNALIIDVTRLNWCAARYCSTGLRDTRFESATYRLRSRRFVYHRLAPYHRLKRARTEGQEHSFLRSTATFTSGVLTASGGVWDH
jgi:hypothetical protein